MPFRRRKPLHERLAEEGGLVEHAAAPRTAWEDHTGVHGVARPRRWDAVATVEVPGLAGDEREFVLLADGTLLGDAAEIPLAEALALEAPFRAQAVRRGHSLWAVAANRIAVVELAQEVGGDALELARHGGSHTLLVDGEPAEARVPELEQLLDGDGLVRAERLDDELWEVSVTPL